MYPREKKGKKKTECDGLYELPTVISAFASWQHFFAFLFYFFFMFCVVGMCLTWKKKFLESKREKRKKKLLNDRKVL